MLDTEYKMIAMIPRVERGELIEIGVFQSISELRKLARKKKSRSFENQLCINFYQDEILCTRITLCTIY